MPEELRKHYLSDGETGQYSTNLDRNRYGSDDQYLFTVVRYDLARTAPPAPPILPGACGPLRALRPCAARPRPRPALTSPPPNTPRPQNPCAGR